MKHSGICVHAVCWTLVLGISAFGQMTSASFGPPGGPYTQVGHYDNNTVSWVNDNTAGIEVPKGTVYEIVLHTNGFYPDCALVGYDGWNEVYSKADTAQGGADCGASEDCARLTLYCDSNHRLHGSGLNGIEGDDTMCVCTKYGGPNQACRDIGVFKCKNDNQCALSSAAGSCISPRLDELHVPANALSQPQIVTFASPTDKPSASAVPRGWSPIAEVMSVFPALALAHPATMVFHYSDTEARGYAEQSIRAFRFDEGTQQWLEIPGSVVDENANTLSFQTLSFGTFGFAAFPEAIPAANSWGISVLFLVLAISATLIVYRKRAFPAKPT